MTVRDDLKAFLDNELPPARMEEVKAAVESDSSLRAELECLKSIAESIRAYAAEPEVVGMEATLQRIQRPIPAFWEPFYRSPIVTTALAMFVIVLVSSILFPVFAQSKSSAKNAASRPPMVAASKGLDKAPDWARAQESAPFYGVPGQRKESRTGNEAAGAAMPPRSGDSALSSENVRLYAKEKAKNRMVVSNAQMSLKVDNAQKALADSQSIVIGMGGYVENSNSSQLEGQLPMATCVFRVPCTRFDDTIQRFRSLGSVLTETIQADDVTLQYADINARLKVIRIEEQQYLTMLRNAKRTGEIMEIRDRLSQVRQQIESMDAQQKALMDQASLSTISVTFQQRIEAGKPEVPSNWVDETWGSAVNALSAVGRFLGRIVIFLFVFSPIWLGALLVYWISRRRYR